MTCTPYGPHNYNDLPAFRPMEDDTEVTEPTCRLAVILSNLILETLIPINSSEHLQIPV